MMERTEKDGTLTMTATTTTTKSMKVKWNRATLDIMSWSEISTKIYLQVAR